MCREALTWAGLYTKSAKKCCQSQGKSGPFRSFGGSADLIVTPWVRYCAVPIKILTLSNCFILFERGGKSMYL